MMSYILVPIYVIDCLFLIGVVLLQQGKGADLAGAFGGGGSQTAFGARSATTVLHRATTYAFVLFIVLSMALSVLSARTEGDSVLGEDAPAAATANTDDAAVPAETGDGADATTEVEPAATDDATTDDATTEDAATDSVDEAESADEPAESTDDDVN